MAVARTYRELLRNGPLARLLLGEFISSTGDAMFFVAFIVVVYRETHDPAVLGLVAAARLLPFVFLSIPAGIVSDRFDRRMVLLSSDVAKGVLMLGMSALAASGSTVLPIVVLAILSACLSTLFWPAIGALIPSLVRDETEFGPANSAWATLDNLAWIVGPALGGLILANGSVGLPFLINAGTFALMAVILWTLPRSIPVRPASPAATPDEPRRGWRSRWTIPASINRRAVGGVILLGMVTASAFTGATILTVVLAVDVFHGGDEATGFLNAAVGAGGAIGALLSGLLVLRRRLGPVLLVGAAALGTAIAALGQMPAVLPAFIVIAVASIANLVVEVSRTTILQRVVPDGYRGRLTGVLMTALIGAEVVGTLVVPALVAAFGAKLVLAALGVALVAGATVAVALIGRAADLAPSADADAVRRIASLPVFAGLSPGRVEAALRLLQPRHVIAGEVVVRQGDAADRFYVISAGMFEVHQAATPGAQGHLIRTLGADDVFGERGILARAPRSASVTAAADGVLYGIDAEPFLELVGAGNHIEARLMALYDDPAKVAARG